MKKSEKAKQIQKFCDGIADASFSLGEISNEEGGLAPDISCLEDHEKWKAEAEANGDEYEPDYEEDVYEILAGLRDCFAGLGEILETV